MTRQFRTEADIARFVKQGFGQGEGSSYKPWIRVQDVPSIGRSQKVLGTKTQRVYHFLSRLEYHYFLLLEFSSQVVDIREQFPLFATARSRDIAAGMGIQYPVFYGTQLPFVLTSDFVITLRGLDGKKRIAVRTCKYESELDDPNQGQGTVEKLDLERALWADQGVEDWKIVTDQLMGPILKGNLEWLHKATSAEKIHIDVDQRRQFIKIVTTAANGVRPLSSIIRSASSAIRLPNRTGILLFKQLVWDKSLLVDLVNYRLNPTLPCPQFGGLNGMDLNQSRQEVA